MDAIKSPALGEAFQKGTAGKKEYNTMARGVKL